MARDARHMQESRRDTPEGHVVFMREMRDLQRQNAKQIAALAENQAKLAENQAKTSSDLQEFITAVRVMQESQKRQDEAIERLEDLNKQQATQQVQQQQNHFTLRNNLVFWCMSAAGVLIGVIEFISQHWK